MDSIPGFLQTGMLQRLAYKEQKIRHLPLASQVIARAPSQLKDGVFSELNLAFYQSIQKNLKYHPNIQD